VLGRLGRKGAQLVREISAVVVALAVCVFPALAASKGWAVRELTDPVTDERRGIASVESDGETDPEDLPIDILRTAAPDLNSLRRYRVVVKCDFGTKGVYVSLLVPGGGTLSLSRTIYRFDRDEPVVVEWQRGRGSLNLFDTAAVSAFTQRAMRAQTMALRLEPKSQGQSASTATFNGSGSAAAIARVYRACGEAVPVAQLR
jgi:hypothetical protein